jgi:hypothetical protein
MKLDSTDFDKKKSLLFYEIIAQCYDIWYPNY